MINIREGKRAVTDSPPKRAPRPGEGRPTKYDPKFVEQAEKLCRLGATDADLAYFFGVDIRTIQRWATRSEEFCRALRAGKEMADARVERSFYQRAVGYTFDAVKIFMPAGAPEPVYAPYTEHVPPDPTAAFNWLKNRKPSEWRDVSRQELSGPDGAPIPFSRVESIIVDPKASE